MSIKEVINSMFRDLFKQILEVFVRLQIVRLRSLYKALQDSAGFCSADCVDHDPVLLADAKAADRPFTGLY